MIPLRCLKNIYMACTLVIKMVLFLYGIVITLMNWLMNMHYIYIIFLKGRLIYINLERFCLFGNNSAV